MLRFLLAFALLSVASYSAEGGLPPPHKCSPMNWRWKKQLIKYLSYANDGKPMKYKRSLTREAVKLTADLQAPKLGHKDLWIEFKNNQSGKLDILHRFRKEYEIKLWKKRKIRTSGITVVTELSRYQALCGFDSNRNNSETYDLPYSARSELSGHMLDFYIKAPKTARTKKR